MSMAAAAISSVRRFVRKLRGKQSPEASVVIEAAPGEDSQLDCGTRPHGAPSAERQVPAHATLRADPRLQPQIGRPAGVPLQPADLLKATLSILSYN